MCLKTSPRHTNQHKSAINKPLRSEQVHDKDAVKHILKSRLISLKKWGDVSMDVKEWRRLNMVQSKRAAVSDTATQLREPI